VTARVAVIAALPREISPLVRGWEAHREGRERGIFAWSCADALVVAAGMGRARATLAVQAAMAMGSVSQLVSVGLAGACDPAVGVGTIVEAGTVIDVLTGERFATVAESGPLLVTGSSIAGVREKARLFETYRAAAVDMEAATVGRLAMANGIAFRAIKAISDDYAFELGSLARFETKHGHFHTRAFALHTAVRPHTWGKTIRLGRHSRMAVEALTGKLRNELLAGGA
jgi:adenosylhomocysteine nucleosidase